MTELMKKPEYSLYELLELCNESTQKLEKEDLYWLDSKPVGDEIL